MFEIICLGRVDFLVAVLNGLAMLTADDGPAGYGRMVALGLLVGVVLTLIRGVVTQRLDLQWVLAGWLLFTCLFVPKVTVVIEDVYTGATTTVANVPLGPAIIGSITSTVGVTLADAFVTVFAVPSLTNAGYMDSLQLIQAMRTVDYGAANDGDATAVVSGIDVQRSMRAYLVDCVYYDISMDLATHSVTLAELRESDDLLSAIEVQSQSWFTTVFLQEGDLDGQTLTCTEAYQQLSTFMRTRFVTAWESYIGSLLGLEDTAVRMQSAVDALFGVGRNGQLFMLNALIKRELELAEVGYHAQANNPAGVIMRVQAVEQRRTQWAAEQSMWAEMARPAIAFIEGFFFAVSPFMAFLFTLGAPGVALFGRYLLLAVWIQLWMPVLAVSNLYITIAASSDLATLSNGGTNPLTIVGLDSVWTETASWLAFGGSMVAATPLLTLILLTGSYFALTRLTDRLAGADHIDEKVQSPNILSPAAVAGMGALGVQTAANTSDPIHGMHRTGVQSVLPSVNFSSDIQSSVRSAEAAQRQATHEWSSAASTGLDLSHQQGREQFISNLRSSAISGTSSKTDQLVERMVQSAVEGAGVFRTWSDEERSTLQAAIGAGVQRGGGVQARSHIDAALQTVTSISDTQRKEIGDRIEKMVGANSDEMAQLSERVQQDESEGSSSRFFEAMRVDDSAQWAKSQRAARSASESFERASSMARNSTLRQDLKIQAIGHQADAEGWDSELLKLVSEYRLDMSRVEDLAGFWSRAGYMDHDAALPAAAALVLAGGGHQSRMALAHELDRHGFGSEAVQESPERNSELAVNTPRSTEITESVEKELGRARPVQRDDVVRGVDEQISSSEDLWSRGQAAAEQFFEAKRSENGAKASVALKKLEEVVTEQRASHFESTLGEAESLLGAIQNFDFRGQFGNFSINAQALTEAGRTFSEVRQRILATGGSVQSANIAAVTASLRAYGTGFEEAVEGLKGTEYRSAIDMGFPEAAAKLYATESVVWQQSLEKLFPSLLGRDLEFERLKEETRGVMGDEATNALLRAATAEPVSKRYDLEGALAIYKSRSQSKEKAP